MNAYFRDLTKNWRAIIGPALGLMAGMSMTSVVNSLFAPYLVQEFGWKPAQMALLGSFSIVLLVVLPVIGRLSDIFGPRKVAMVGVIGFPASLVYASFLQGNINVFYAIILFQAVFCTTTTTTIYCRIVAERTSVARGVALSIAASAPALAAIVAGPLLTDYIEANGWRAGYQAFALYSIIMGIIAILLSPKSQHVRAKADAGHATTFSDYRIILKNPTFWLLFAGAFLASMPLGLAHSQLTLILTDKGIDTQAAAIGMSAFFAGTVIGRLGLGVALDIFPVHLVGFVGMGVSAIGLAIMGSPVETFILLVLALGLIGFTFGAEGDLLGYASAKYFDIDVFGSVMGLLNSGVAFAIFLSSTILSIILARTDSYFLFVWIAAICVLIGCSLFLLLKNRPVVHVPGGEQTDLTD